MYKIRNNSLDCSGFVFDFIDIGCLMKFDVRLMEMKHVQMLEMIYLLVLVVFIGSDYILVEFLLSCISLLKKTKKRQKYITQSLNIFIHFHLFL